MERVCQSANQWDHTGFRLEGNEGVSSHATNCLSAALSAHLVMGSDLHLGRAAYCCSCNTWICFSLCLCNIRPEACSSDICQAFSEADASQ